MEPLIWRFMSGLSVHNIESGVCGRAGVGERLWGRPSDSRCECPRVHRFEQPR
jgi:hypothetical protein